MPIATLNPATGETVKTFESLSDSRIEEKLEKSIVTFRSFRRLSFSQRSSWMMRAAEILEAEKQEFGRIMTLEMGKPLKAAGEEVMKCASACRFYAENAERFLADEEVKTNATRSFIHYQAIGPVLAVMPWNFPFWQVFRFAAPALMAGNVGLLKHASNVPQCSLAIEDIFLRAGFPEGAFQTLLIGSKQVPQILDDSRVVAATLTGSEPAGSQVASQCGKLIKKTVLELGGSDPFIVMPSADLEEAIKTAVKARSVNSGQSCIAAKRFIIAHEIYEEFERGFVAAMKALKVGDPMEEDTDIGPLATREVLETVEEQVNKSVEQGARLLTGGHRVSGAGNFYETTVLSDIPEDSPAYTEEVFGPVAMLFRVRNIEAAIRLANDTTFGLGSSAWTNDEAERALFIDDLEAGAVFINGMVASDPRLPFGGIKNSGYGRELSSNGIREFTNIKTVWIKESGSSSRNSTE